MRNGLTAFLIAGNTIDALLTHLGLQSGAITEANPFMDVIYETSPYLFLFLKLCLPLLLLLLVTKLPVQSRPVHVCLAAACVVYVLVLSLHGFWMYERISL